MGNLVTRHQDLDVYRKSFESAMTIFELTKSFSKEQTFSLTDQVRRSSRSVSSNIAEAWRKRRYQAAFVSKLWDAEGECAETQTWIEFAVRSDYLDREKARGLFLEYDGTIAMIVGMINVLPTGRK